MSIDAGKYRVITYETATALFGGVVDDSTYDVPQNFECDDDDLDFEIRRQHNKYIMEKFSRDELPGWRVTVRKLMEVEG